MKDQIPENGGEHTTSDIDARLSGVRLPEFLVIPVPDENERTKDDNLRLAQVLGGAKALGLEVVDTIPDGPKRRNRNR